MLGATEKKVIFTLASRQHFGWRDLPEVALFFKLIYRADKPTVKEEQLSERNRGLFYKAFAAFNPPLTDTALIARPLVCETLSETLLWHGVSFTRLQTSTLQCFLQIRQPEFAEHCWQPFTRGDETRGNSSVVNANSQHSGSTRGCFNCFPLTGMVQVFTIGAMGLTAQLRCGPLCSVGFRCWRFRSKQVPCVSRFKAFCSGQGLLSCFNSYSDTSRRFPVLPD